MITPDGERAAVVSIRDGIIEEVLPHNSAAGGDAELRELRDLVVMPGLVDTHVHINEPGRTDWEGFASATRAAAAGGITTVVDMPLNSTPATTTAEALSDKIDAMRGKCTVDVGIWGGVVPGNAAQLGALRTGGVLGFKCFMVPSGVDDFEDVGEHDLRQTLPVIAELGVPLLVHAESPEPIMRASAAAEAFDPSRYSTYLRSRPVEAELQAIELLIRLSREFGAHIHIVHVATGSAAPLIRDARDSGVRITAETCPHYLYFSAEEIGDRAFAWKCAPPIRESPEKDRLLDALGDGTLDLVASDHSPSTPSMKDPGDGSFFSAWGGIASLQLSLAATWTAARRASGSVIDIARWMSAAPAALAGLDNRKGAIVPGHDADLVVWDPRARFTVDAQALQHRHKLTPYHGRSLSGVVVSTYLRGRRIYHEGAFEGAPEGRLLT